MLSGSCTLHLELFKEEFCQLRTLKTGRLIGRMLGDCSNTVHRMVVLLAMRLLKRSFGRVTMVTLMIKSHTFLNETIDSEPHPILSQTYSGTRDGSSPPRP